MTPSDSLIEWLLGIAEGVAAFGEQLDEPSGERLAVAVREAVDRYWQETGSYPAGARTYRDEVFSLLLNTSAAHQV
jgi:hypothetical protein